MVILNVICKNCKQVLNLQEKDIEGKVPILVEMGNGFFERAYITSFKCQYCGKVHYTQLDNEQTNYMLSRYAQELKSAVRARKKNKSIKSKSERIKSIQSDLAQTRKELIKRYTEKLALNKLTDEVITIDVMTQEELYGLKSKLNLDNDK